MELAALTDPSLIFTDLEADGAGGAEGILRTLTTEVIETGRIRKPKRLFERLLERESLGSTALGNGVAVPHCRLAGLAELLVVIGISREPIPFDAEDGEPVRLFFLVVSPEKAPGAHLRCLAAISHWLRENSVQRLMELKEPSLVFAALRDGLPSGT